MRLTKKYPVSICLTIFFLSFHRDTESKIKVGVTQIKGKLKCFNTLNEFNLVDKNELLDSIGNQVTLVHLDLNLLSISSFKSNFLFSRSNRILFLDALSTIPIR